MSRPPGVWHHQVLVFRLNRTAKELFGLMFSNDDFRKCHERLLERGFSCVLGNGATVFVEPDLMIPTLEHLRDKGIQLGTSHIFYEDLRYWHVIASSPTHVGTFVAMIDRLPQDFKRWVRFSSSFPITICVSNVVIDKC